MSYCRFRHYLGTGDTTYKPGDKSDVYVFGSLDKLECYVARSIPGYESLDLFTTDRRVMLAHLHRLRHLGIKVPRKATKRLKREIRQIGWDYNLDPLIMEARAEEAQKRTERDLGT